MRTSLLRWFLRSREAYDPVKSGEIGGREINLTFAFRIL